jgi:hypothetical protein
MTSGGVTVRRYLSTFGLSLIVAAIASAGPALAQSSDPAIVGTWKAELSDQDRKDAPREIVVRPDSSASWAREHVRWRLKPDSIMIALGGEWVTYRLKVTRTKLTLSGGDLAKPITLTRIGPPTPRPDSVPVPPDPDAHQ